MDAALPTVIYDPISIFSPPVFITINRGSNIFYLFVYCLSCLNINRFFNRFFLHIIVSPCFTYSVV